MDKIKNVSIKRSMAITFIITICIIGMLSGITVFLANRSQQEILRNRYLMIKSPDYKIDKNADKYTVDMDGSVVEWHGLSTGENIAYFMCYFAMIGLPVIYIIVGIGSAAAIYYRMKLKVPILQLQNGMKRIQDNDLDFCIEYCGDDELGELCNSMEKMRKELCYNNKALWETLRQRKLLNASVAHDLRTPITVLRGYIDFLEKNVPQDKLTEEMLMDTISSMQGAVLRLERYVECVRDVEKIESIEIRREQQDMVSLLKEMESNIHQLAGDKKIDFLTDISFTSVSIDKSVLFRVLENLFQNAMRYMNEQIIVEVSTKENLFFMSIKDDGKGFSEEDLRQATNMFYGKEKGKEHFGIGLGVSRVLCEKHGGFLKIGNNKMSGAYVTAVFDISE
ncbi:HAMP domain-containing sensor histidine kinase [Lachnospiraceae bacterium 48-21]